MMGLAGQRGSKEAAILVDSLCVLALPHLIVNLTAGRQFKDSTISHRRQLHQDRNKWS
jgi:hypothetical protein